MLIFHPFVFPPLFFFIICGKKKKRKENFFKRTLGYQTFIPKKKIKKRELYYNNSFITCSISIEWERGTNRSINNFITLSYQSQTHTSSTTHPCTPH